MTVTTQNSTEIANGLAVPAVLNPTSIDGGRVRTKKVTFVQSGNGDATSIANLALFRAGRTYNLLAFYRAWSAMGASRTMDTGLSAYTDGDGVEQAADPDKFEADVAVTNAGAALLHINQVISPKTDVYLTAQINDGQLDAGETITGYLLYTGDD